MKTKNIEHKVVLRAAATNVYDALMNSKKHTQFTGEPARISTRVGGAFTCYGDYIRGLNLELVTGERIVQAWRSQDWAEGVFSIVTFSLAAQSGGKTLLRFTQVGVPAGDFKRKNEGWKEHYWEPLKRFLEE